MDGQRALEKLVEETYVRKRVWFYPRRAQEVLGGRGFKSCKLTCERRLRR